MNTFRNQKTAAHLMHQIITRNGRVPNFSLFLGSGASISSGIQSAQDMIECWRKLLFERAGTNEEFGKWLRCQSWVGRDDEYSVLFEAIYDQPALRRVFVEECIKTANPSWGYVYLADLLANRFFDIVLTTNFDDLMNEACYLYSDGLRPIVAAHDSAIQGIRITSERPKIVKLHGDFLYDNIKNTVSELETLEVNIKHKMNHFAKEYGLVVVGYSGRDRSVMDTLELLLKDDDNYRQGVYWCICRGAPLSNRLSDFLNKDRVYLIEIDGFDEFVADLHNVAELEPPKAIVRPIEVTRDRLKLFDKAPEQFKSHPVIGAHIGILARERVKHNLDIQFPPRFEASLLAMEGEIEEAVNLWAQIHEEDPTDLDTTIEYASVLAEAGKNDELANLIDKSHMSISNKTFFLLKAGRDSEVIGLATEFLDDATSQNGSDQESLPIVRVNRAIAFKRLGRLDEMGNDLDFLEQSVGNDDVRFRVAIAALKGNEGDFIDKLALHLESFTMLELRTFPVFEDYQEVPEFCELVKSKYGN